MTRRQASPLEIRALFRHYSFTRVKESIDNLSRETFRQTETNRQADSRLLGKKQKSARGQRKESQSG